MVLVYVFERKTIPSSEVKTLYWWLHILWVNSTYIEDIDMYQHLYSRMDYIFPIKL